MYESGTLRQLIPPCEKALRFSYGALVHLVGCDEYKCHPLSEEDLALVGV